MTTTDKIHSVSTKFNLDEERVTYLVNTYFNKWEKYVSEEEFLALIVFGQDYSIQSLADDRYKMLESYLNDIPLVLDDRAKLLQLNQLGFTGICDFDKVDSEEKRRMVAEIFGRQEIFDFLLALSQDQRDQNTSVLLQALIFQLGL